MRKLLSFLLIVLTLTSCRFAPYDDARAPQSYNDWATLFDDYWDKMNRNYSFFSLDSPLNEWDEIYAEYRPKFEALKNPIGTNADETRIAARYYFDILSDHISDHHYTLKLNVGGKEISFQPPVINYYKNDLGRTQDEAFNHFYDNTKDTEWDKHEFVAETQRAILNNTFGIETTSGSGPRIGTKTNNYFEHYSCYVINNKVVSGSSFNFTILSGMTKDGILYLSIEGFSFSSLLSMVASGDTDAQAVYEIFRSFAEELNNAKAVIVDLRGNPGGDSVSLSLLWSLLFKGEVNVTQTRLKLSDNRTDYTEWQKTSLGGNAPRDYSNIPFVLLTNNHTASCAEVSLFICKALAAERGFDVTVIGTRTIGANGALAPNVTMDAGSIDTNVPYINIRMASLQLRSHDEVLYEGKGIAPDIVEPFDYASFTSGTDTKLNRALTFLNEKIK